MAGGRSRRPGPPRPAAAVALALCAGLLQVCDGSSPGQLLAAAGELRLREWLEGLSVSLPQVDVMPSRLGFAARIDGGLCRQLRLGDLRVLHAAGSTSGLRMEVLLSEAGFSCAVDAAVEVLGFWSPCTVRAAAANASLQLGVELAAGPDGLPAAGRGAGQLNLTCAAMLPLQDLEFTGSSLGCKALSTVEGELRALVERYASEACEAAVGFLQPLAADAVQSLSGLARPLLKPAAPMFPPTTLPARAVDLRKELWDAPVGVAMREFFREVVHSDDPARLNSVLGYALRDVGLLDAHGSVILPAVVKKALVSMRLAVAIPGSDGSLVGVATVGGLSLSNLTSFDGLDLDVPEAQIGHVRGSLHPAVALNVTAHLELPRGSQASLSMFGKVVNVTQSAPLAPVAVALAGSVASAGSMQAFVAFDREGLKSHKMDQMQRLGCCKWITVDGLDGGPVQLLEFRARFDPDEVHVAFPGLPAGALEQQLLQAGEAFVEAGLVAFGAAFLNLVEGVLSGPGRDFVNDGLAAFIAGPHHCPASNFSSGDITVLEAPLWVASCSTFVLCMGSLLLLCSGGACLLQRSAREVDAPSGGVTLVAPSPSPPGTRPVSQAVSGRPLLLQAPAPADGLAERPEILAKCVPRPVRWAMAFGVLSNILFFGVATVTPGVSIVVFFRDSVGDVWQTPDIADLSMSNSLVGMLQSGAIFVALAVLLFSMVWPYVKLLAMLYAFLAPMKPRFRGHLLVFLDQVGKWSLTDNVIMFLLMVLFVISWEGTDTMFELRCVPGVELNAFVGATVMSLVMGHVMLAIHRWQQGTFSSLADTGHLNIAAVARDGLWKRVTHKGNRPSSFVSYGTLLSILGVMGLLVTSFCVDIVELHMDGLVGTFKDVTNQPRAERYSMLRVARDIGTQGSVYLQAVLVFFTMFLPAAYLFSLLMLWVVPLQSRFQRIIFSLCQTVGAWSSLDVFVVAYLAAVLGGEKYGIAQFLDLVVYHQNTGPLCMGLREVGVECLVVRITMLELAALPVFTAICLTALGPYVYSRAHLALHLGKTPIAAEQAFEVAAGGAPDEAASLGRHPRPCRQP